VQGVESFASSLLPVIERVCPWEENMWCFAGTGWPITPFPNCRRTLCRQPKHPTWTDGEAGILGLARTVPPGMVPGSDVANLSIFGYDPTRSFTGRAPLEAAAMGSS
jgi:hypothetical protein